MSGLRASLQHSGRMYGFVWGVDTIETYERWHHLKERCHQIEKWRYRIRRVGDCQYLCARPAAIQTPTAPVVGELRHTPASTTARGRWRPSGARTLPN